MAKTKEQKQVAINNLKKSIASQKASVFIDFSGVEAEALFKLRDDLKKEGCNMTVTKKSLLKRVLNSIGEKDLAKKVDEIKGQLALVFGFEDEAAPSRICYEAGKVNENIKILGGILDNEYQDKEQVMVLAQLPSKQVLLGRLVGSLNAPVYGFVHALKGNLNNLVCVLSEIQKVKS